jgi:DNA polymerase V
MELRHARALPAHRLAVTDVWPAEAFAPGIPRPLFLARVRAGFPSPADDHLDTVLSLDDLVRGTPQATFFVRVEGDSMTDAHICDGDVLVVDRAREPADGDVVVATLDGELTVKRLHARTVRGSVRLSLHAAHPGFPPIAVQPEQEFTVWGVVTHVVHKVR